MATLELTKVVFSREWMRSALAQHVRAHSTSRALGSASAKSAAGALTGVLVRHARTKTYTLVTEDGDHALDTGTTDDFLAKVRRGHHGGPGRAQGPVAKDGTLYTQRCIASLPRDTLDTLSRLGDGVISLGARKLAVSLPEPPSEFASPVGKLYHTALYLSPEAKDALTSFGDGNLSRGIRAAAHRRRARRRAL